MLHQAALTAFSAVVLALAAPSAPQAGVTELSARDQKELGTMLGKALDPKKQDFKDKEKSLAELRKFFEKAGKTRNPKDPLQGGLSMTGDLSKALHLSADYKLAGLKPGAVATNVVNAKQSNELSYAVWVPKAYKPGEGAGFPLILCLPGAKDGKTLAGDAFLVDNWTDAGLREKVLIAAVNLPADAASWTEAQTADGKPGGIAAVMMSLRDLRSKYAIDFDRVYLSGRESGVAAALSLGSKFPQVFAGVIGRSGDAGEIPADNFRNLPTFFAGGGAQSAAFEEQTKKLGYNNCTLKADGNDADALAWIDANPRTANPAKVTLVPGRPIPSRVYWMKVPPTDAAAASIKIEGEIDRAKNTITITGVGVRQVTLMLNDVLVDLDKPVTVVLNGTAREALLTRSLEDTLAMMYDATSEPGRVYVVRQDFDLPEGK